MEVKSQTQRKPFQGVGNILRFNWHFYLLSLVVLGVLFVLQKHVNGIILQVVLLLVFCGTIATTAILKFVILNCKILTE